ncbi:MAG: ECF-type sigma factor, partial [Actinomycetota bacterium]
MTPEAGVHGSSQDARDRYSDTEDAPVPVGSSALANGRLREFLSEVWFRRGDALAGLGERLLPGQGLDLAHETFLRAWEAGVRRPDIFAHGDHELAARWMKTDLRRQARARRRADARRAPAAMLDTVPAKDPAGDPESVVDREGARALLARIAALPPTQIDSLALHAAGLSREEAARRLGLSPRQHRRVLEVARRNVRAARHDLIAVLPPVLVVAGAEEPAAVGKHLAAVDDVTMAVRGIVRSTVDGLESVVHGARLAVVGIGVLLTLMGIGAGTRLVHRFTEAPEPPPVAAATRPAAPPVAAPAPRRRPVARTSGEHVVRLSP